jgi:hypothetical protein
VTLSNYEDQAKSQMVWDEAAQGTQVGGQDDSVHVTAALCFGNTQCSFGSLQASMCVNRAGCAVLSGEGNMAWQPGHGYVRITPVKFEF